MLMEIEKHQAFDELFLEYGVEESDISAAFNKHELKDSEDYKKMIETITAKL